MFSIIFILLFIILAFWFPLFSVVSFIVVVGIIEAMQLIAVYVSTSEVTDKEKWTEEEQEVIKKYHVFFGYPFGAKAFYNFFSAVKLSIFVWVPVLIYKDLWIPAIIIGLNYFVLINLLKKINPRFYLHEAVQSGKHECAIEMQLVDSVIEKLYGVNLNASASDPEFSLVFCTQCGKELGLASSFCKSCGAERIKT